MKRSLALFLALLLVLTTLAGCSKSSNSNESGKPNQVEQNVKPTDAVTEKPSENEPAPTDQPVSDDVVVGDLTFTADPNALASRSDVRYMLIYNPDYTDDARSYSGLLNDWRPDTRNTGDVSTQIDVDMDRADPLEQETKLDWISQGEMPKMDVSSLPFDSDRAGGMPQLYSKGDTHQFYTTDNSTNERYLETYTCLYEGEHCYIWLNENAYLSEEQAQNFGERFDNEVYDVDTRLFGQGRFTEDGGKVNFMFCSMGNRLGGYFWLNDIFSVADGMTQEQIEQNCLNVDHAIVFINADFAVDPSYEDTIVSTMAHEFQHQICQSAWIDSLYSGSSGNQADTWYNEAMSGFVEEYLYPGIQQENGRYWAMETSDTLRTGQSMYNFSTAQGISPYGSVFLFAEYLAKMEGEQLFKKVYDYWRYSGSPTLCTAEAIYESVSDSFRDEISQKYAYTLSDANASEAEVWMSKLLLDFYITMFHYDPSDPEAFAAIKPEQLLYNSLYPSSLDLESGGRAIFAVNDGKFTVPSDANPGMIYVGLDDNYQPVGVVVVQ